MTRSQIELIIGSNNINKKLRFENISSIALDTDNCIYPGRDYLLEFHFKNNSELLLVWKCKEVDDEYITGPLPESATEIDAIEAIRMVSKEHPTMPYLTGRAV